MRSTGSSTVHKNITNAHETKDSTHYRPCTEKKDESGNPENMQYKGNWLTAYTWKIRWPRTVMLRRYYTQERAIG